MKSLFIKTNNQKNIDYLLNKLENLDLSDTYYSCKNFKHYTNIIIHYHGNDVETFCSLIASLLSYLVLDNLEESIIKEIIFKNYFYFDKIESNNVINICKDILSDTNKFSLNDRYILLFDKFYEHILAEKKLYLNAFLSFRAKNFFQYLENIVDIAVNQYIIEREYLDFISLLKLYINSHSSNIDYVSLCYNNSKPILFDKDNNVIDVKDDCFDLKYLSDISFSSNDYVLNALLTLIPKKIVVHNFDSAMDDFVDTLLLIFENRVTICR